MRKIDYLENEDVRMYVAWLAANLDNDTFRHQYVFRKTGKSWSCSSLGDAFIAYQWRFPSIIHRNIEAGSGFESNAKALETLRNALHKGLGNDGSDALVKDAAIDVMKWGGVSAHNTQWLEANSDGLFQQLVTVRDAINAENTSAPALLSKNLRFNAGMTKVYSLICEDFIIYDSRVAATIGWSVVKFCLQTGRANIPKQLNFPYALAKESPTQLKPKRRDPSFGNYQFSKLHSGSHHAVWNLKASWVLKAALSSTPENSQFRVGLNASQSLRALEAAMFMYGYDLPSWD